MDLATAQGIATIVSAAATLGGFAGVLLVYWKDRQNAERARQVEVHAHATFQWREIVRLAVDHEELRPLVIRGAVGNSKEVVLFELVNVLMAYIRLVEARNESGVVGASWVEGWKALFKNFMMDSDFVEFLRSQQAVYDAEMNRWIEQLIAAAHFETTDHR